MRGCSRGKSLLLCDQCADDSHGDCVGSSQLVFGMPICECNCPDARRAQRLNADRRSSIAQLFYTWEELDLLAELVEAAIVVTDTSPDLSILNSLRTSLREAQEHVH